MMMLSLLMVMLFLCLPWCVACVVAAIVVVDDVGVVVDGDVVGVGAVVAIGVVGVVCWC